MKRKIKTGFFWILLLALAGSAGCTGYRGIRQTFVETGAELLSPEKQALLETLRILILLEDYRKSLEMREVETIDRFFSPRFSYYENDLVWMKAKLEEELFSPFSDLQVTFFDISIDLVEKRAGHWMRQEDFNWLEGPAGEAFFPVPYLIALHSDSSDSDIEVLFETDRGDVPPPDRTTPGRERSRMGGRLKSRRAERVKVRFISDPEVATSLGEVTCRQLLQADLVEPESPGLSTYQLQEEVIFLLEKEGGEWKIVSIR